MFYVDRFSGTPLYRQLYKQLLAQIRTGQLPAGSRLPGSRTLASTLGIRRNTVDNAYSRPMTFCRKNCARFHLTCRSSARAMP